MNIINFRASVRFKSDITNSSTLTNAQILTELNEAYYDVHRAMVDANEDYFEEQNVKFNLAQNSSLYSLPTDCVKMKQVRLAYTTPSSASDYKVASSYDPAEVGQVNSDEENIPVSTPIVDITNNYFRIKPTPTSAVTNGGIIFYIARPSALTNTGDTPLIPTEYQDLMAIRVAARACEKFEMYSKADRLYQQYEAGINKMKSQIAVREMNRDFRMRDIREITKSNRVELPN